MFVGLVFAGAGGTLLAIAALSAGAAWILAWPGVAAICVGLAYAARRARWLGKTSGGEVRLWARLLYAPLHALFYAAWWLSGLWGEAAWDEVAPGIFVGRRPDRGGLPPNVGWELDMTCELQVPLGVRTAPGYRCIPTLDGLAPRVEVLRNLILRFRDREGTIFVHCAKGHGRSATVAAGLIVTRGLAPDVPAAVAMMQRARPRVRLSGHQRRRLEAALALF